MANVHSLNSGGRNNRPNAEATFSSFWYSVPPITRHLLALCVIVSGTCHTNLIAYDRILFTWRQVFMRLQIWRALTSCLLLPANLMPALMEGYNLYNRCYELEQNFYLTASRPSLGSHNFAYYILFCLIVMPSMAAFLYGIRYPLFLTSAFTACLTFTWSLHNSNTKIMFYGVLPIWGKFFPILQLATTFVMGSQADFNLSLMGIATAYIYCCIDTWSFGPLVGYFINGVDNYGMESKGYMEAPRWFVSIYNMISGETQPGLSKDAIRTGRKLGQVLGRGGQRLGTKDSVQVSEHSVNEKRNETEKRRAKSSTPIGVTSGINRAPQSSTNSNAFQGTGKRIGDD
uniref:Derlin n=1 Tax=Nakaseomyces delphensis TaxID=51657 RepID=A7WPJ7_NAKDE|nr:derlin-like family member [Nakaseomyces delphensis]